MKGPDTQEPAQWAPSEHGVFIVELGDGGEPVRLHTFQRRRERDPSKSWTIFEVSELRKVDPMSPAGPIEGDGGFYFFREGTASVTKAKLVAFVEGADPRLHHEPDRSESWIFE